MNVKPFNVLFLCTGNSARSILAGAPALDFVLTVCDNAAHEVCPVWPGQPMTAHWGVEDPAAVEGSEAERWLAFRQAFKELESRIKIFTSLPIRSLDRIRLQRQLDAIGKAGTEMPA